MVTCFIIIKTTISYEFITFTHTMVMGQLHTYPIDFYVKHAHLYIKHRLNSSAYHCRRFCRHSDVSTFFERSRGCRDNGCWLYPIVKANTQFILKTWVFTQLTWKLICFTPHVLFWLWLIVKKRFLMLCYSGIYCAFLGCSYLEQRHQWVWEV